MAQRDDQFEAEAVDESKVGENPYGPADDSPTFPPEHYQGASDPTADDWVSDSVRSRAAREDWDEDDDGFDPEDPALRLVGDGDEDVDDYLDDEKDLVARQLDADPDDLSAEEAAVHVR
jgi:hypothetical protein